MGISQAKETKESIMSSQFSILAIYEEMKAIFLNVMRNEISE